MIFVALTYVNKTSPFFENRTRIAHVIGNIKKSIPLSLHYTFLDPEMICIQNTLYNNNCSPDLYNENKPLFLKIEQELLLLLTIFHNSIL